MQTATVREIRNSFPKVLRHIRNGESVAITSRRKVVATLTPPSLPAAPRRRKFWANLPDRMAELKKLPRLAVSGSELTAQERDRY